MSATLGASAHWGAVWAKAPAAMANAPAPVSAANLRDMTCFSCFAASLARRTRFREA